MILPSKHLPQDRALLTVGARLLAHLERPITVSALWQKMQESSVDKSAKDKANTLSFDWFVLALDLLHLLGAIHLRDGILVRNSA